ncbi:hypothetical protein [Brunnivagina elsteri]|uniref:P pilus assembly protein, chaperone PapD n=1 Tax=Brunnivagina elsteri CCALA 953 TaxID=987040 RepID=A0A2A2TFZ6_9CYAN|nr:hypothetical protein [Calothrix elsteri]PAX52558.1 hypothetical protein CK510_18655 [Calothrix elsteri CCALA 953]
MNINPFLKFSLPLATILSNFFQPGNSAKADIAISPMILETQAQRGQAKGIFTVSNLDEKAFRARVYTSPFTYDKEKGFQALTSSANDLAPYLQFSPRELQVEGSTQRSIRFITRFPPSLPDGEYRTMIFTENLQAATVSETDNTKGVTVNTAIIPRIGVAVYVRKGNISPNLVTSIARFNTQTSKIQLLVTNKGKASAITSGEWKLKRGNQTVQTGNIGDTTVIAECDRYLSLTPSKSQQTQLSPGDYELSGDLTWGDKKNTVPFKVTLTIPK